MKRFVLLVCAVVLFSGVYAGDAVALFQSYSKMDGVTCVTLTRKTFNLMKPFLGLDKETRRVFDALNLKQMDMLQFGETADREKAVADLRALCADSSYVSVRSVSDVGLEDGSDFLLKIDGNRIVDFVVYTSREGELVAMKISCDADVSRIMNLIDKKSD